MHRNAQPKTSIGKSTTIREGTTASRVPSEPRDRFWNVERMALSRKESTMSSSSPLETHRTMLQQQVLPAYERLGSLTLVYLLGSLVSGYTQDADLDMLMVWDELDVPAGSLRELLVARFEERPNASPCVVDYRDIHLERIVLAGQEYNVARLPLASFEAIIQSVLLVALLTPRAVAVLCHAERGASSAEKPEITAKPTKVGEG